MVFFVQTDRTSFSIRRVLMGETGSPLASLGYEWEWDFTGARELPCYCICHETRDKQCFQQLAYLADDPREPRSTTQN